MGTITIQEFTTKNPITMIGYEAGVCWGADVSDDKKNYNRGLKCIHDEHGRTWEFPDIYSIIDGYSAKLIREFYTHIGGSPTRLQESTRYIDYSKGDGFNYVVPITFFKDKLAEVRWKSLMRRINTDIQAFINDFDIPIEDATMALPLAYTTKW